MRKLLRAGSSALLLLLIMFFGSLVLWVGVPLGWLYVGSQVQSETDSIGTALLVMVLGVTLSLFLLIPLLGWLNRKHSDLRELRGLESYGQTALEGVLVVSAGLAVVIFGLWFFLFSGSEPIPFELSY
jgi:zinc transporter ZupT